MDNIPGPNDWERFKFYARKIKTLRYATHVYEDYMQKLTFHRPPGDLLPNLKSLVWRTGKTHNWDFISLFLSSSLISAEINLPSLDKARRLMKILPNISPGLRSLHFHNAKSYSRFVITPQDQVMFNSGISSWRNITSLQLGRSAGGYLVSINALRTLSLLPKLEVLKFQIGKEPFASTTSCEFPPDAFSSLLEIQVRWSTYRLNKVAIHVLKAITSPKLFTIAVCTYHYIFPQDLSALLEAVSTHHAVTTLQLVHVNNYDPVEEQDDLRTLHIPSHKFALLFQLSKLEILQMVGYTISYQNQMIMNMALSWPAIQTLTIDDQYFPEPISHANIIDFQHFATHSTHLHTLSIPFYSSIRQIDHIPAVELPTIKSRTIEICLSGCKIDNPMLASACLYTFFRWLKYTGELDDGYMSHTLKSIVRHTDDDGDIAWEYISIEEWATEEVDLLDLL